MRQFLALVFIPVALGFSLRTLPSRNASGQDAPSLLLASVAAVNDAGGKLPGVGEEACGRDCTEERALGRPVCGTDGRTYPSRCDVWQARCKGHQIKIKHKGKCPEGNRCEAERAHALASNFDSTQYLEAYIPECLPGDAGYAPVQCHKLMGYCWCVTETGQPIPGTSLPHRRPQCSPRQKKATTSRRSSRGKKKRRGCSPVDRSVFNNNLVEKFITEHARESRKRRPPAIERKSGTEIEKEVINWKFAALDSDKDGFLSRKEFKDFRQLIKKVVKPRRCAKKFTKFCDVNYDRKISREEWIGCFGVDANKFLYSGFGSGRSSGSLPLQEVEPASSQHGPDIDQGGDDEEPVDIKSEEEPEYADEVSPSGPGSEQSILVEEVGRGCLEERKNLLQSSKDGAVNMYVPECTPDGHYAEVQCYSSGNNDRYCFCVRPLDGSIIDGSSVKGSKPDCDKIKKGNALSEANSTTPAPSKNIVMKGCTGKKKSNFLQALMDNLTQGMFKAATNDSRAIAKDGNTGQSSIEEKAARWKFLQLDTNENRVLDKREWKEFRAWVTTQPSLKRKCGKRLPRYCDVNDDSKITMEEWLECLGAKPSKSRRRGPNPFKTILRSD